MDHAKLLGSLAGEADGGDELESVAARDGTVGVDAIRKADALRIVAVALNRTAEKALMQLADGSVEHRISAADLVGICDGRVAKVEVKQQHVADRRARERVLEEQRLVIQVRDRIPQHRVNPPTV